MALVKFIRHTAAFSTNLEKAMLKFQRKYGDSFFLQLMPHRGVWFFSKADAVKEVFSAEPETFANLEPADAMTILVGSDSLIVAGGEQHLCHKRAMLPIFNENSVKLLVDTMRSCTHAEIKKWRSGGMINISAAMQNISLNIIISSLFGIVDPQQIPLFRKQTRALLKSYTPSLMFMPALRNKLWYPWRKFLRARAQFDRLLLKEIEMVRQAKPSNRNDFLSGLAKLDFPNGQQWTALELCDQLKTLLIAGHDTLSIALGWAIFYIYSHPAIHARLLAELQSADNLSIETIVKLPYLDAVRKEVLRFHPAVPFVMRTLAKPYAFGGQHLPAGSTIGVSITLLHSDPTIWKNPMEFNPDRFLTQKFSSYEYAPFGGGVKKCLGGHFAVYEMKIILVAILLNYQFDIQKKEPPTRIYGLTMNPRRPIFGTVRSFKERKN